MAALIKGENSHVWQNIFKMRKKHRRQSSGTRSVTSKVERAWARARRPRPDIKLAKLSEPFFRLEAKLDEKNVLNRLKLGSKVITVKLGLIRARVSKLGLIPP